MIKNLMWSEAIACLVLAAAIGAALMWGVYEWFTLLADRRAERAEAAEQLGCPGCGAEPGQEHGWQCPEDPSQAAPDGPLAPDIDADPPFTSERRDQVAAAVSAALAPVTEVFEMMGAAEVPAQLAALAIESPQWVEAGRPDLSVAELAAAGDPVAIATRDLVRDTEDPAYWWPANQERLAILRRRGIDADPTEAEFWAGAAAVVTGLIAAEQLAALGPAGGDRWRPTSWPRPGSASVTAAEVEAAQWLTERRAEARAVDEWLATRPYAWAA